MANPNLESQGEWGFLNRLLPRIKKNDASRFLVPVGDDAAVLKQPNRAVLSIDGLTDGTHFKSSWGPFVRRTLGVGLGRALGWKLLSSGLSDLAAMGETRSRWAMVYLGAPASTKMDFLMDLYRGVRETCARAGCAMAGGDTVRAKELTLVVAVGGEQVGRPIVRSGARVGDLICVTRNVGDASLGLDILLGRKKNVPRAAAKYFVTKFFRPEPHFKTAATLSRSGAVMAMMDLSDPLDRSIGILARDSGAGARVDLEKIPRSAFFHRHGRERALLSAAEDYGLLFTVRPEKIKRLKGPFAVIGRVERKSHGVMFFDRGRRLPSARSFEHFA
jgi:thiamine-monophosphate kinase